MTALALTLTDSRTMVRRSLRRMVRYPSLSLMLIGLPLVFLLLFVFVFGGTLGAGLGEGGLGGAHIGGNATGAGTRADYLAYVIPGILLMAIAAVAQGTAISVAMDMTGGIIARFRTMDIARTSVLTGHVVGATIQTLVSMVVVLVVAVALGFRTGAGPVQWVALLGVCLLFSFALTWLAVALGLAADSVETASNTPMFLTILPFLGSGFVPTDSMPTVLRWFADYQPFTPAIETVRGLLAGTAVSNSAWVTLAWSVGIALASYLWARRRFETLPAR